MKKLKILLAEDDFATRKFMLKFLEKYGEVDVTVDGMEAVDAFLMSLEDEEPYDLVCLDVMMPVMDGYQALMGIRNIEKQRNSVTDSLHVLNQLAQDNAAVTEETSAMSLGLSTTVNDSGNLILDLEEKVKVLLEHIDKFTV